MSTKGKISIVVPIYRVEKYLAKCIESIILQTYRNIEVMLIDDGSPDRSGEICDKYAQQDSRIKVFHEPNGGVAKARQIGVENSTGEYIVFVDADDSLPHDSIHILYSNITDDIDIVIGSVAMYKNGKRVEEINQQRIFTNEQYIKSVLAIEIGVVPWARIYRRSLFTKDSFPVFKRTQDLLMNAEVCFRVGKVKVISEIIYFYTVRYGTSSRTFVDTFQYEIEFCQSLKEILDRNNSYEKYIVEYSKVVLMMMYRPLIWCNHVNVKHPMIINACDKLKDEILSPKLRIIRLSFLNKWMLYIVYLYNFTRLMCRKIFC